MTDDRILVYYLDHSNDFSGGQKSLLALLQVIDRKRFDPVVLLDRKAVKMQSELKKLDIEVIAINYFNVKIWEYLLLPLVLINIWVRVVRSKCRILHCNTFKAGMVGALLSFVTRRVVIFRARLGIVILSHGFIDKIIFKFSDLILANSHYVKETFNIRFGESSKVKAVYNPLVSTIRLNEFILSSLREKYFRDSSVLNFGMIGRIEPFKKIHDVIEASALVRDAGHAFKVLIIGDKSIADGGEYFEQITAQIKRHKLTDHFVFTGFVAEIHEITSLLDYVILSSEGEALSRGVYESQFLGIPVIATDSGGNPEVVTDKKTGLLFKPNDPGHLAQKMIYALTHRDEMKSIAASARVNVIELFDEKNTIRREENLYIEQLQK